MLPTFGVSGIMGLGNKLSSFIIHLVNIGAVYGNYLVLQCGTVSEWNVHLFLNAILLTLSSSFSFGGASSTTYFGSELVVMMTPVF